MALEPNDLHELVDRDVSDGLVDAFQRTEGLGSLDTFGTLDEPISSGTHDVLPWQWAGRHMGSLAGIPPTGRDVVVRGVTIVENRDGELVYHRFVDWLGVFEQLGAMLVTRPAVEAFPDDLPDRDRFGMLGYERDVGDATDSE